MWSKLRLLLPLMAALALPARADELRVLTSFPASLSETYRALFVKAFPGVDVRVLNKNTNAALDEVLRGNPRHFDLFWSSSPEAFELLRRHRTFAAPGACGPNRPPSVAPFAYSSVGWTRRRDSTLFMPADWDDLLRPLYRYRVAMALPSRSGSAHMTVERFLQVRGWNRGWAYFLQLSANLATLTARSFGVPDGVINKRFAIGISLDFLAQSHSDELDFRYGTPILVSPAQIGILASGDNLKRACDFVGLVLSPTGQTALIEPQISRVPADPAIRARFASQLPKEILEALQLNWMGYDAATAGKRYWAVNALFDILMSEELARRQDLWERYNALVTKRPPSLALARIFHLLTRVPVSEEDAIASGSDNVEVRINPLVHSSAQQRALLARWRTESSADLDRAERLLTRLDGGAG